MHLPNLELSSVGTGMCKIFLYTPELAFVKEGGRLGICPFGFWRCVFACLGFGSFLRICLKNWQTFLVMPRKPWVNLHLKSFYPPRRESLGNIALPCTTEAAAWPMIHTQTLGFSWTYKSVSPLSESWEYFKEMLILVFLLLEWTIFFFCFCLKWQFPEWLGLTLQ